MPAATEIERKIVADPKHFRRGDITSTAVRSTMVRVNVDVANPVHDNTQEFQVGDVVVGNDDFAKYKNELQIVLEPHKGFTKKFGWKDSQEELIMLDFLKPWSKFQFVPNN